MIRPTIRRGWVGVIIAATIGLLVACTPTPLAIPVEGQPYLEPKRIAFELESGGVEPALPTVVALAPTFEGNLRDVEEVVLITTAGTTVEVFRVDDDSALLEALGRSYEVDSGSAFTDIRFAPLLLGVIDGEWFVIPVPAETAAQRVPSAVQTAVDNADRTLVAEGRLTEPR